MLRAAAALLLVAEAAAALVGPRVPVDYSRPHAAKHPMQGGARVTHADMQFSFKPQKSERLLIREAWEKADAFRPGKANWFTQRQKSLRDLHHELLPLYDTLPPSAPARVSVATLARRTGRLARSPARGRTSRCSARCSSRSRRATSPSRSARRSRPC